MDNEYNIDFFSQAGNLMDEVQEAKKLTGEAMRKFLH